MIDQLTVSTPGRICLFGEHQDYLHLPVIPAAISLRMTLQGHRTDGRTIRIRLPDIGAEESFLPGRKLPYTKQKDYFRSVYNVLVHHGFSFSTGIDAVLTSTIPVNAGTSSSSALSVGWVNFLARMSDQQKTLSAAEIARFAFEAEVLEFREAGGMMDQYSTAYGGVITIDFLPAVRPEPVDVTPGTFVLGDSCQPKDTQDILFRVKNRVLDIVGSLGRTHPDFSLPSLTHETVGQYRQELDPGQYALLDGTVLNHDITREARSLLRTTPLDDTRMGELLTRHHAVLRDVQKISTRKIDAMLDAALDAGALGGKINGSGGGGCMFAYAPDHAEQVSDAIEKAGGKAYIVSVDEGTRAEDQ